MWHGDALFATFPANGTGTLDVARGRFVCHIDVARGRFVCHISWGVMWHGDALFATHSLPTP